MTTAKELFDMSLNLQMNETLLIPAYNKGHQESLRVSLSYNRRLFVENTLADYDIIISKLTKNDMGSSKYYVKLQKLPRITTGIIIAPDGSMREASLNKDDPLGRIGDLTTHDENVRIRNAMKEDGYTDNEIDAYLASKPSKNDALLECFQEAEGDDDE
jgi:hypothetical protein